MSVLADMVDNYEERIAQLEHDIEAYRGCLGYSVSGDHDGLLSDGSQPKNGIAEALTQQLAVATAKNAKKDQADPC